MLTNFHALHDLLFLSCILSPFNIETAGIVYHYSASSHWTFLARHVVIVTNRSEYVAIRYECKVWIRLGLSVWGDPLSSLFEMCVY